MISDTKVVAIGGGTGLSTMLKGLKLHTHNITAVVTVADDGGSSGILRSDLGMLAPGDVRNCVSALAEVDPVMGELLNFRFKDGSLKGHSLGNLFLAALNETSSSFDEAVKKFSHLTGVVGTVYPVTNESVTLSALLEDGRLIEGESHIGVHHDGPKNGIVKLMVNPESRIYIRCYSLCNIFVFCCKLNAVTAYIPSEHQCSRQFICSTVHTTVFTLTQLFFYL